MVTVKEFAEAWNDGSMRAVDRVAFWYLLLTMRIAQLQ